eukprot:TRINITY_DN5944_c0_g1_i3.p1 TRINITY_DN5944_c0_g1~~TRINITY_DN5944_c0_g1_i3.p1  ORF type:complete len:426 (+),score=116.11 TRINITY_DN5944_c0_g1_i3:1164-2441(+)
MVQIRDEFRKHKTDAAEAEATLQKQLDTLQSQNNDSTELQTKLQTLQSQLDQSQLELSTLEEDQQMSEAINQKLQKSVSAQKSQLADVLNQLAELTTIAAAATADLLQQDQPDQPEQAADIPQSIQILSSQIDRLHSTATSLLDAAQQDQQQIMEKLQQVDAQRAQLLSQLEDGTQASAHELHEITHKMESYRSEATNLQHQLKEAFDAQEAQLQQYDALKQEFHQSKEFYDNAIEGWKNQCADHELTIHTLQTQLTNLDQTGSQLATQATQIEKLTNENTRLKGLLIENQDEFTNTELQYEEKIADLTTQLEQANVSKASQVDDLSTQLQEQQQRADALQSTVKEQDGKIQQQTEALNNLQDVLRQMSADQHSEVRLDLQKCTDQLNATTTLLDEKEAICIHPHQLTFIHLILTNSHSPFSPSG